MPAIRSSPIHSPPPCFSATVVHRALCAAHRAAPARVGAYTLIRRVAAVPSAPPARRRAAVRPAKRAMPAMTVPAAPLPRCARSAPRCGARVVLSSLLPVSGPLVRGSRGCRAGCMSHWDNGVCRAGSRYAQRAMHSAPSIGSALGPRSSSLPPVRTSGSAIDDHGSRELAS